MQRKRAAADLQPFFFWSDKISHREVDSAYSAALFDAGVCDVILCIINDLYVLERCAVRREELHLGFGSFPVADVNGIAVFVRALLPEFIERNNFLSVILHPLNRIIIIAIHEYLKLVFGSLEADDRTVIAGRVAADPVIYVETV